MPLLGLEREYFLLDKNNNALCNVASLGFPHDEGGFLVEARGDPHNNIVDAIYSLLAQERKITIRAYEKELTLAFLNNYKFSKKDFDTVQRTHRKGLRKYKNLYGYLDNKRKQYEIFAALHLSITFPKTFTHEKGMFTYNSLWDYVSFFKYLDEQFKEEIKVSRRLPGFYEIKDDGRVEYRSLPMNVDSTKLIKVVSSYNWYS